MTVIVKLLGVFSILAVTQAYPVNFTVQTAGPVPVNASGLFGGLCAFEKQKCPLPPPVGAQCPQCDANGNFLPMQHSGSTGYCWCVNIITGEIVPNTTVPPGNPPPKCGASSEEDSDSDSSSSEESSSKDKSDSSSSEETKKDSGSSSSDESKKTEDGSDSSSSEETKEEKDSDSSSSDESKKEDGSDSSSSEETKEEKESDSSSSEETKEEKDSDSSSSEETKEEKDSDSSSSDESKKDKNESDSSSSEETKEEKDSDSSSSEETKEEKDSDSSSSEKTKEEKDSSSSDKSINEHKESDSCSEETKEDKDSDSTSSSEEDSGCPDDWTRFGQQCFIFIDSPKSWAEAQSYCQFDGSNLASVHSYEENHFLQSLTRGDSHHFPQTWIGGTDTMHLGLWTWSDGSKFLYENWSDDGKDGKSDCCLKINYHYDLKWTATRCAESLPFICSKNAEKENEA